MGYRTRRSYQKISADYQHLTARKNEYCTFIKKECSKRELLKEETFKTSNLNIKLQKYLRTVNKEQKKEN